MKDVIFVGWVNQRRAPVDGETAKNQYIIAELEKCGHDYNKVKVGPACTEQKGVEMLKQECRHFAEWIAKLELLGNY